MNKTAYRLLGIFVAVVLALGSFFTVRASTATSANQIYYISPSGSDTNDCSLDAPCATVEAVPAQPGDTIILQAGLYTGHMDIYRPLHVIRTIGPGDYQHRDDHRSSRLW